MYLEAEADSSSSQFLMCLTFRLKMAADCRTSDLRRRTTALTPATVRIKLVKAIDEELRILIWFSRVFQGFHSEKTTLFLGTRAEVNQIHLWAVAQVFVPIMGIFLFVKPKIEAVPFPRVQLISVQEPKLLFFFFFLK